MKHFALAIVSICFIALVPRLYSVQWNVTDHGDIAGDATAAASLLTHGKLLASHNPDVTSTPHFMAPGIGRNLLIAHPPIWALLGSATLKVLSWEPTFENAFSALKILSLLSGMSVVILCAVVTNRLFGKRAAVMLSLWVACSYLMIDYSGNGALYSLQAAVYLVWIWVAYNNHKAKPITLGVASGIGYLVNHQSMVLAAASVVVLLCTDRTWRQKICDLITVTITTFLVCSPWLIRNFIVYGDLFYSHTINSTYVYTKTALPREIVDGREQFIIGFSGTIAVLKNMVTYWIPNNLYYIARKLFILAPVAFFFFSFAWIDYLFSKKRIRFMLPILALFVLHTLLSASWPVTKFRYFVPMLPLVFLISTDQILHIVRSYKMRAAVFGGVTVCILFLSFLTYLSVPTHTYYYDGAITNDPFHGRGEYEFMEKRGLIPTI